MLASRTRIPLPVGNVPVEKAHVDWCAHTFTAQRFRYTILTNTHSFLSVVMRGSGIGDENDFIRATIGALREYLVSSDRRRVWEQLMEPAAGEVRFARIPDRRVMGTINELVFQATVELIEGGLSPHETSDRLNQVPLSALWNRGPTISPGETFDAMPASL